MFQKIHENIHNFVFIAGVLETGDKALSRIDFMTPVINLSPVSTTPVIINRR
jgi:hypothetical protein